MILLLVSNGHLKHLFFSYKWLQLGTGQKVWGGVGQSISKCGS